MKNLDNVAELVRKFEEGLAQWGRWFPFLSGGRLSRFYPFYPYLFIFLCHFPLYYLHVINPNRVSAIIWLHLISLSSYVTRGKYRCRLSSWPTELALLVNRVYTYTGKTPFQGYSGVDYLEKMIPTFNKSSFYHLLNCHLDKYLLQKKFVFKISSKKSLRLEYNSKIIALQVVLIYILDKKGG